MNDYEVAETYAAEGNWEAFFRIYPEEKLSGLYVPLKLVYTVNKIRMWLIEKQGRDYGFPSLELRPIKTKCPHCKNQIMLDVEMHYCVLCQHSICAVCGSTSFNSYRPLEAIMDDIHCANCGEEIQGS